MPVKLIKSHLEIPLINFDLSDKFWPLISAPVKEKYGTEEVVDPALVQEGLKASFSVCASLFMAALGQETRASFYLYVQHLLENTHELYQDILAGKVVPIDKSELANIRRTLRIILEQSVTLDLKGAPNFLAEINANVKLYIEKLDELLYLDYQAFIISQEIARSQLFPKSTAIDVNAEGLLAMTSRPPYNALFDYLESDIPKHDKSVTIYHSREKYGKCLFVSGWRSTRISLKSTFRAAASSNRELMGKSKTPASVASMVDSSTFDKTEERENGHIFFVLMRLRFRPDCIKVSRILAMFSGIYGVVFS